MNENLETNAFYYLIEKAYNVAKNCMGPDFNPLKGHTYTDHDVLTYQKKPSYFIDTIHNMDDLLNALFSCDVHNCVLKPGCDGDNPCSGQGYCLELNTKIGTDIESNINPDTKYTIQRNIDRLHPYSTEIPTIYEVQTQILTVIIKPETTDDKHNVIYSLVSAFPGYPTPIGDWTSIYEGDILSGEQLIQQNIVLAKYN